MQQHLRNRLQPQPDAVIGELARGPQQVLGPLPPLRRRLHDLRIGVRLAADVREHGQVRPPDSLRDAHYPGAKKLGRGAGYIYINIDDTWEGERDTHGVIHTNSKFPAMKALADYAAGLR